MFITFEGIEGSGKSTQVPKIADYLRAKGRDIVTTREPGGTTVGDRLRQILLAPSTKIDAVTELLMYAASRRQHVMEVIRPALERGAMVLCDRYTDSTLAYQGFGRELNLDDLRMLNQLATGGTSPSLTLLYDLSEEEGLARAQSRNVADGNREGRFEAEELRFHRRVREGYLSLVDAEPERWVKIDARGTVDEVFARTLDVLESRLP